MKYIKRDMESLILTLSQEYSCILITGPRQVGKTTMLEHIMAEDRHVVSLDDLQERALAKNDPGMFLKLHPTPVLIDEIQYAPELFSYIKIAIDKGAPAGSFWLTGSQAYKLMNLAQESLAGRTAILHLSSISQHELYGKDTLNRFSLNLECLLEKQKNYEQVDISQIFERIWTGSLPGFVSKKYTNRDVFYSSYLQTYISRDISEELPGINQLKFIEFIRATACRVGQLLNIHSIAVDVDISDDTAKRWLGLLEKSDIIYFLNPYSNNLLKRTIKNPKLYFFDTGLVAYLTKYSTSEILLNGALNGAILENYVVNEIRNSYLNLGIEPPLYYYHDKDNNEIDIIIEQDGFIYPLEIKKSNNPNISMIKSFNILKKSLIPLGTGAILCTKENISAINSENLIIPIFLL